MMVAALFEGIGTLVECNAGRIGQGVQSKDMGERAFIDHLEGGHRLYLPHGHHLETEVEVQHPDIVGQALVVVVIADGGRGMGSIHIAGQHIRMRRAVRLEPEVEAAGVAYVQMDGLLHVHSQTPSTYCVICPTHWAWPAF